jgi:sugar lactone lactonase YvrE
LKRNRPFRIRQVAGSIPALGSIQSRVLRIFQFTSPASFVARSLQVLVFRSAPERMTIADKWADGTTLTVRPNDFAAYSHGGAYFTSGCLYYARPKGVTVVTDNIRTNGIAFSPDDKILYVTNGGALVAFDVEEPGMLNNRRDFAMLSAGTMATAPRSIRRDGCM